MDFQALLAKEQKNIDRVKAEDPQFFVREPQVDSEAILKQVGIAGLPKARPVGYIKLWPQDFIVEEIDIEGKLHSVLTQDADASRADEEGETVYADSVKVGMSTIDVRAEVAQSLGIEQKSIGTAGIKDRDALTSQLMSFRRVPKQAIADLSFPNIFFKNIRQGKGVVDPGRLQGNRFTITVRMQEGADSSKIESLIEEAAENGFWNFYYLQRFGTPRLLTHIWGLYILRGEYETAVKIMMTREGVREVPLFKELRKQAEESWGDWDAIEGIFDLFPLSFRSELTMLAHLKENREDFRGALAQIPQQVQLGVYAYSSFLFNSLLSTYIQNGQAPPEQLPLFLSKNKEYQDLYKKFSEKHALHMPSPVLRDFPFIQWAEHLIPTRVNVQMHSYKVLPNNIVIIDFSLPKGSYATSFLTHFFTLSSGLPVLSDIETSKHDFFEILGRGGLQATLDRFQDVIFAKFETENKGESE